MKRQFSCAFSGIAKAVKKERSMRVHLAFTFYILLAAAVTGASGIEWCAILICIGTVITAELLNTAIERLCNAVHPEKSIRIGAVKDTAAGAVMVLALASAAVGGVIFFNAEKINATLEFAKQNILPAALIVASVPAASYLVFRRYD